MDDEVWYQIVAMNFQMSAHDGGDGKSISYFK